MGVQWCFLVLWRASFLCYVGFLALLCYNSHYFWRDIVSAGTCVTTALPYANGDLHLGHILEQIQADIWCRFQRLKGQKILFVGGDDAHGTAIMLSAEKNGVTPEAWVEDVWTRHQADIADFGVEMDMFYTTRSPENQALVEGIYQRLLENGSIATKSVEQAFDVQAGMFLPDRFIRGGCPRCKAPDQYGDHCEVCGAHYLPTELINPYSVITKTAPEPRSSEHVFFQLSQKSDMLNEWIVQADLQTSVSNKLQEWLKLGLQDWDISRDAPYFGFQIPNYTDKYFYVWMDAPVGYMAAVKKYDSESDSSYFPSIFSVDSDWDLVHFIGKDLVNFHGVFWPTVLVSSGYRPPSSIHVHGFIMINGEKMSKSKGTFVTARDYLNVLSPEYLRYYFACKLSDSVVDIDLNWQDFVNRCNADLVGKVVNIGSRTSSFIHKYFSGELSTTLDTTSPYTELLARSDIIQSLYEAKKFHLVTREIIALADLANQYVDQHKPWQMVKQADSLARVQEVCSTALHLFWIIAVYLQPIVPTTSRKISQIFDHDITSFDDATQQFLGRNIEAFPRVLERITLAMCPQDN